MRTKLITIGVLVAVMIVVAVPILLSEDSPKPVKQAFATKTVHYPARQKTQLYSGLYDKTSDTTYAVYAAGVKDGLSACSPYIIAYDHKKKAWGEPVEVFASTVRPDSHNYPQLMMDSKGYLHLLHSFHGDHVVRYAKSNKPRSIEEWTVSDIDDTKNATYGAAFRAKNDDMYYYFRHRDNKKGERDYEPEYYLKSTDQGKSWKKHILIDPVTDHPKENDGWGTVYTKSMHYVTKPVEGIQIVFGIHKNHNIYLDEHYYVFHSFKDDNMYSADGKNRGRSLDRAEIKKHCLLFKHGKAVDFYNVRTAIDMTEDGTPYLFHTYNGKLLMRFWNGKSWDTINTGMTRYSPFELELDKTGREATLYAIESRRKVRKMVFRDKLLVSNTVLYEMKGGKQRLDHLTFFKDAKPELKGFFFQGVKSEWRKPTPTGNLIAITE